MPLPASASGERLDAAYSIPMLRPAAAARVARLNIQSIFILWWWNHGTIQLLVVSNSGAQVHFAPILTSLHLPILIIAFACLTQH